MADKIQPYIDIGGTELLTSKDLFTNDGVKGIVFCWSVFSSVDLCSLSLSLYSKQVYTFRPIM